MECPKTSLYEKFLILFVCQAPHTGDGFGNVNYLLRDERVSQIIMVLPPHSFCPSVNIVLALFEA